MTRRTLAEINAKIQERRAVVWTAAELKARVKEWGVSRCAREVDVITTGTFEPMEASGAILNLGQTDPPIKLQRCWLDGVPAYTGFGAVDVVIGASQPSEVEGSERGGGHVIADLIAGRAVTLKATGYATDCYPRATLETRIRKDTINQFYLYNPRNLYQNFIVGVNGGDRTLYTYLGPLLPQLGNAVYACGGALSPLLNDPDLQCVGIGTRIFLGGGVGYIAWEGTQHFPLQKRLPNRVPIGPAATVALIGDARQMDARWVRGCFFKHYGPSLYLGVGVPFPVLDEQVIAACAVQDEDIVAPVVDFAIPRRVRPTFGLVTYAQLKSGRITINGTSVRTAPLVSLSWSLEVAEILKHWIEQGQFTLTEPVAPLPQDRTFLPQDGLD
ncbi:MAG: homocysteine biosynthesis protein [Gloeomargarita sp. HHBFW_bins_205]